MNRRELLITAGLGVGGALLSSTGALLIAGSMTQPGETALSLKAIEEPTAAAADRTASADAPPDTVRDAEAGTGVWVLGGSQSPVNIAEAQKLGTLQALDPDYRTTKARLINDGYTFQVAYDGGSGIAFGGRWYALKQFHFHTPSEHLLNDRAFPMEMHLVHQDAESNLAVLAVFLSEGAHNAFLGRVWTRFPRSPGEAATDIAINVNDLWLPEAVPLAGASPGPAGSANEESLSARTRAQALAGYYTYPGSLTTPPYSENVTWVVLKKPVEVSPLQVQQFREVFPNNARPVMPLGPRLILEYSP